MIYFIEATTLLVAGFFFLYLAILSVLALTQRDRRQTVVTRYRRFAIVVPAHDEESGIERTVRSLLGLEYPRPLFDIVVIADNCTDRTEEIAAGLGAQVHVRNDLACTGKGYALRWCFDRLLESPKGYDAFVVIDADTIASSSLLTVMNNYLDSGARVVQCSDIVAPQSGSWSSEMTRIGFLLYNHVRPLGRHALGCSAGLRGNGMCFATDILRAVPWNAFSQTEDLEYGLNLLQRNVQVVFAPEVHVMASMPSDHRNARSQRARWEVGRYPIIRTYALPLLHAALRHRSFTLFDAFVDLVTPPLTNLLSFSLLMLLLTLALWGFGVEGADRFVTAWLVVMGLAAIHANVGLVASRATADVYSALRYFPRYLIWKLALYGRILWRGQTTYWVRTTREKG